MYTFFNVVERSRFQRYLLRHFQLHAASTPANRVLFHDNDQDAHILCNSLHATMQDPKLIYRKYLDSPGYFIFIPLCLLKL